MRLLALVSELGVLMLGAPSLGGESFVEGHPSFGSS